MFQSNIFNTFRTFSVLCLDSNRFVFITGMPKFEEFVCTESSDRVTDRSPLFGLDCEMVNVTV